MQQLLVFHFYNSVSFTLSRWYISQWAACSTTCGRGLRARRVHCVRTQPDGNIEMLSLEKCPGETPRRVEVCVDQGSCPKWFAKEWSQVCIILLCTGLSCLIIPMKVDLILLKFLSPLKSEVRLDYYSKSFFEICIQSRSQKPMLLFFSFIPISKFFFFFHTVFTIMRKRCSNTTSGMYEYGG